jgi:pyruvate dehydrogenase E1 component alpha subunit
MNLAALWQLPVLFLCENNLYAMGTALERSESETNLAVKAASYEVPAWSVDGMDVLAVSAAAERAVDAVRTTGGPVFLEARTYRFRAHSMYDADRYRDKAAIEHWRERDPLVLLRAHLTSAGTMDDVLDRIDGDVSAEIDTAVAFAEAGTEEPVESLLRFVTSEVPS